MTIKSAFFLAAFLMFWVTTAAADDTVGGLRKVQGSAIIERDGERIIAKNGLAVMENDIIRTGKDGAMGIVFRDNTRLSIGPNTELTLTRYLFEPAENKFAFLTRIIKGTAAYISGSIGKLAPEAVAIETPTVTIGIRGTRFCTEVRNP